MNLGINLIIKRSDNMQKYYISTISIPQHTSKNFHLENNEYSDIHDAFREFFEILLEKYSYTLFEGSDNYNNFSYFYYPLLICPANLVKNDEIYDKVTIKKELLPFVYDVKIKKLKREKLDYICRLVDKAFY